MKKILIELPTWLGDAVMCTPALNNIIKEIPDCEITLFGSFVSIELLNNYRNVKKVFVDNTRKNGLRIKNIKTIAGEIGKHDLSFTFRNSFYSALLLFLTKTPIRVGRKKGLRDYLLTHSYKWNDNMHQVEKYNSIVNVFFNIDLPAENLSLNIQKKKNEKKYLGINPGAAYGSAKRWYPEKFGEVAEFFSGEYDIKIFGGPKEIDIAKDIEKYLKEKKIKNIENLAGKTTIKDLCDNIAKLSIFITGDSGPMHIAAALSIPTVCIFGPTDYIKTCQWKNPKSAIVSLGLKCSPCQKRICPLKHHRCMKDLNSSMVIKATKNLLN